MQVSRGTAVWIGEARLPCRHISVAAGDVLSRAGEPLDRLFLPIGATVLIARRTPQDPVPLPVGLIGYEGIVGWQALLAVPRWTHTAIVVTPGEVCVVARDVLLAGCAENAVLHSLMLRVVHNHTLQLSQSVVANLGHSAERRLARWLLMLDDRTVGDTIAITHASLAQLLNVRRVTVTDGLHALEGEGLIVSTRGRVRIRDRGGLEGRAAQSYGLSEDDYDSTIEPFGKRVRPCPSLRSAGPCG